MHWEKGLRLGGAPRHDCRGRKRRLRKTAFLSHFYIKTIILPRQARDKHRESTQKKMPFFAPASAGATVLVSILQGRVWLHGAQI
jgi:hypothetical protein